LGIIGIAVWGFNMIWGYNKEYGIRIGFGESSPWPLIKMTYNVVKTIINHPQVHHE